MKELARSGNIGRVFKTESDMLNSLSTGETSVGHGANTNFMALDRDFPIKHLTKVPGDLGLKTAIYVEGWAVMKGEKAAAAFDLANYTISPGGQRVVGQNHSCPAGQPEVGRAADARTAGVSPTKSSISTPTSRIGTTSARSSTAG